MRPGEEGRTDHSVVRRIARELVRLLDVPVLVERVADRGPVPQLARQPDHSVGLGLRRDLRRRGDPVRDRGSRPGIAPLVHGSDLLTLQIRIRAAEVDLLHARVSVLELVCIERPRADRRPAALRRRLHLRVDDAAGPEREHAVRVVLADGDDHRPDRPAVAAAQHHRAVGRIPDGGHVAAPSAERGSLAGEGERSRVGEQRVCSPYRGEPVHVDLLASEPHHLGRPERHWNGVAICSGGDSAGVQHGLLALEIRIGGDEERADPRGSADVDVHAHRLGDAPRARPAGEHHLVAVPPRAVDETADHVVGIAEHPGVADHDGQPRPEVRRRLDLDHLTDDGFFLDRGDRDVEPEVRRARRAAGVGHRRLAPRICHRRCQHLPRAGVRRRDPDGSRRAGIARPADDDELPVRPISAVDPAHRHRVSGACVEHGSGETSEGNSSRQHRADSHDPSAPRGRQANRG